MLVVASLLSKNHSIVIPGLTVKRKHTRLNRTFLLSEIIHGGFPEVEPWYLSLSQLLCLVISFIAMQKIIVYWKECRFCHIDCFQQCSGENWLPHPKLVLLCMCVKFHPCLQRDMVTGFLVQTRRYGNTVFFLFYNIYIPITCHSRTTSPFSPALFTLGLSIYNCL